MSIDTDYKVLRDVLADMAHDQHRGWAAEFGVASGHSLRMIKRVMPVIGFDSFEGLPEDWREGFPKGAFANEENQLPPYVNNAMIVPGLFEDTAVGFPFPPLALVHIDCDLYSSTVTALDAVADHIGPGTIIVFDEMQGYPGWEDHEAKAWDEFCAKYRVISHRIAEHDQEVAFLITGGFE